MRTFETFSNVENEKIETFSIFFSRFQFSSRLDSDEELALRKSLHHSFPTAHLVSFTRHVKDNAIRQLQDIVGCESKTRNYLISNVFGEDGLMAAEDAADFDSRAIALSSEFTSLTSTAFVTYFWDRMSPLLRANIVAGLSKWTSNNVESLNHVLKQATNWCPQMLPDLVETLQQVVDWWNEKSN